MSRRGVVVALLITSCATLPRLPDSTLAALTPGASLQGQIVGLQPPVTLNDTDFVYDAQFSADSRQIVLSRLGMKSFDALVWNHTPPSQVAEAAINAQAFDVESVAFSPDGKWIAAVSRDGSVRLYDARTGAVLGGWLTEEPLTTVAFHPGGAGLAVGSEKGTLTMLTVDAHAKVRFSSDLIAHRDALRSLAFAADGRLFTAGWDKTIAVFLEKEEPVPSNSTSVRFERKGGFAQLRGTLNDAVSVVFALDARMPHAVLIRSAVAQSMGLEPSTLPDTIEVTSSYGPQRARVAHGVTLQFKGLTFDGLDAVICDACIPAEAQGVLGSGFHATTVFDDTTHRVTLAGKAATPEKALTEVARFSFPAYPNDLSLDRAGRVLGVAFSQSKAERTPEVYQREKRHEVEPEREWDIGARVDAQTGAVLQKYRGHHGVVATAAISPDGSTLATGGWDKTLRLHVGAEAVTAEFGWSVRRVRFSPDGRWLAVAAWTPQNPLRSHRSNPSALVWELAYSEALVVPR